MYSTPRLDTPPPTSQFRRPWSPDPYDPLPATADDQYFIPGRGRNREPSDVSVEALDLADYARTLRPHQSSNPYAAYYSQENYPPQPPQMASRDSLSPPSLVSRGGTTASSQQSHSSSSRPSRRPFSLPPLAHHPDSSRYPYLHPPTEDLEPEIDITHFPAWSQNWYNSKPSRSSNLNYPVSYHDPPAKRSPFDPAYPTLSYPYPPPDPVHDPYGLSSRDADRGVLPWTNDPPSYDPPIDADIKQERLHMLEREFGAKGRAQPYREEQDTPPVIGSVDPKGNLITVGPKKRTANRFMQFILTLTAGIPSIYAALTIKNTTAPPPQATLAAYLLYVLSVLTLFAFLHLFIFRPCCCGRRRPSGLNANPLTDGMMVLPIPGTKNPQRKKKKGKRGGPPENDVQVNLIVDPGAFGRRDREEEEEEDEYASSVPGSYGTPRRRAPRRRSVFAGLAMEEQWRTARGLLKKAMAFDVVLLVVWGAEFVVILVGKRCPSGGFNGWCNAYNTSSAAACLLCISFGLSVFFDIKDLSASRSSPRTRA